MVKHNRSPLMAVGLASFFIAMTAAHWQFTPECVAIDSPLSDICRGLNLWNIAQERGDLHNLEWICSKCSPLAVMYCGKSTVLCWGIVWSEQLRLISLLLSLLSLLDCLWLYFDCFLIVCSNVLNNKEYEQVLSFLLQAVFCGLLSNSPTTSPYDPSFQWFLADWLSAAISWGNGSQLSCIHYLKCFRIASVKDNPMSVA